LLSFELDLIKHFTFNATGNTILFQLFPIRNIDGNGNGKMTHRGNPNLTHSLVRKKCFHAF